MRIIDSAPMYPLLVVSFVPISLPISMRSPISSCRRSIWSMSTLPYCFFSVLVVVFVITTISILGGMPASILDFPVFVDTILGGAPRHVEWHLRYPHKVIVGATFFPVCRLVRGTKLHLLCYSTLCIQAMPLLH